MGSEMCIRDRGYPLNWTSLEAENEDWPEMGAGTDAGMLPTPTTQEVEHPKAQLTNTGRRKTGKSSHSLNLADTLQLLPTPQARDWKGAQGRAYKGEAMDLPAILEAATTETQD